MQCQKHGKLVNESFKQLDHLISSKKISYYNWLLSCSIDSFLPASEVLQMDIYHPF